MENQLNTENNEAVLEQIAQKQDYLEYIEADIEAYYEHKISNLAPDA